MNQTIAEIESQTYKAHHKSIFRAIVNPTIANGQGIKDVPGNRSRLEFNATPPSMYTQREKSKETEFVGRMPQELEVTKTEVHGGEAGRT